MKQKPSIIPPYYLAKYMYKGISRKLAIHTDFLEYFKNKPNITDIILGVQHIQIAINILKINKPSITTNITAHIQATCS